MPSSISLSLTENAARKVQKLLEKENDEKINLRVFVSGGGCSGFQYGFTFDEKINDEDTTIEDHGVKLLVDPMSMDLLKGSEIDYQESLQGSSFVIRNPNVGSTCGCGQSFTPSESGGCANAGY
ncbi:MAG: iron-sulfur cluster insertion protein ErpA [Mariprofundaceae bacterium]